MKIPKIFIPEKNLDLKVSQFSIDEDDTKEPDVENLNIEDLLLQEYSSSLITKGELTSTAIVNDYPFLNLNIIDRKVFACYEMNREESVTIHILKLLYAPNSSPKSDRIATENYADKIRSCVERLNTRFFPVICYALTKDPYILFIYSDNDSRIRMIVDTYKKRFHLKEIFA